MKKNAHIIQISGLRGIILVVFVASCLAAGFIGFPALAAMYAWNYVANFVAIPEITYLQGLMLWAIVAIALFIINDRKKYLVAFNPKSKLSQEELDNIMERVRIQRNAEILNSLISEDLKLLEKDNKEEKNKDKENV